MRTEAAQTTSIATTSTSKLAVIRLVVDCVPYGVKGRAFHWHLALADKINEQTGAKLHGEVQYQFAPMLAWLQQLNDTIARLTPKLNESQKSRVDFCPKGRPAFRDGGECFAPRSNPNAHPRMPMIFNNICTN